MIVFCNSGLKGCFTKSLGLCIRYAIHLTKIILFKEGSETVIADEGLEVQGGFNKDDRIYEQMVCKLLP